MNATMTISSVRDPNPWNKDGQLKGHFINGTFDDGMNFSLLVMGQRQAADETAAALRGIIGKPGEFEYEERTTNNGSKELKLKSWPGKPQQGQGGGFKGGGGKGWSEAYSQSKEAHEVTQRSIQRACALERATEFILATEGPKSPDDILKTATKFYAWLSADTPQATSATPPTESVKPSPEYLAFEGYIKSIVHSHADEFKSVGELWKAIKPACERQGLDTADKLKACRDLEKFNALKAAVEDKIPIPF